MTPEQILAAWHAAAVSQAPPDLEIWDGHTHTGDQDPDGFVEEAGALVAALVDAGHAGAVVMSNANPSGYVDANDRILEEAQGSAGRLIPFCRVDPREGPAAAREAERCLDRGHRGIKLHPRAEQFSMSDAGVARVCELAAERGAPILVHAGRGIPSLGQAAVALLEANPQLNIILAHCGISDLSHLGPIAAELPGLFFDTSWWDVTDRLALHAWVPPAQVIYASDTPYGWPALTFTMTLRAAKASGYGHPQLRGVFGEALLALLDGSRPGYLGPPSGTNRILADPGLIRVHASVHGAIVSLFANADIVEPLSLARLACEVPSMTTHEDVYRAIAVTLDAVSDSAPQRRANAGLLIQAAGAALTPEVPVPDLG